MGPERFLFLRKLKLPTSSSIAQSYSGQRAVVPGFGYESVTVKYDKKSNNFTQTDIKSLGKLKVADVKIKHYDQCKCTDAHLCGAVEQKKGEESRPRGTCTVSSVLIR